MLRKLLFLFYESENKIEKYNHKNTNTSIIRYLDLKANHLRIAFSFLLISLFTIYKKRLKQQQQQNQNLQ
jgi:hypothetical protein